MSAALHEAAHSVVRQTLIGNLTRVWVNDKGEGKSEYPPIDHATLSRDELAATAVVILAGVHAERRLIPAHQLTEAVIKADLAQARTATRLGGFSDDEMKALDEQAGRFVTEHEPSIRTVAKRLNLCGRLRGAQVSEIMARTSTQ
ncbi:MAG: hypothetical protein M3P49_11060 [Actinomycetota bacterium]|nr:hypothetical protein [Actinomycetota bacterium]